MKYLSVVTITYNNPDLKRTLDSVLKQKGIDTKIEHIIVDNLSNDGTKELVESYIQKAHYPVIYIREKDTGRYDAMNKGIKAASGKYLSFMNAGDHYYDESAASKLIDNSNDYDIIYGNLNSVTNNKTSIYSPPDIIDFKYFLNYNLPHQASIIKKEIFNKIGLYDDTLKISSDHNFFLQAICKHNASYCHLNETIATYYCDGISSNPKMIKTIDQEKAKVLDNVFSDIKTKKVKSKSQNGADGFNTPILFVIFNRLDTAQKVFDQICSIKPKFLYIAADGPRPDKEGEVEKCQKARSIVDQIDWDCHITTLFRKTNFGCAHGVSKAITWFFEQVEEGIILEDDCIPNESFFSYCAEMLQKYRFDTRITHINGTSFVLKDKADSSYYFSKYYHVWGWATWRRAWENYDLNMTNFPKFRDTNAIAQIFNNPIIQDFWMKCFESVYTKSIDTWDYQWVYTNLINNGLSIMPYTNMISNIGFGTDATHTHNSDDVSANRKTNQVTKIVNPSFVVPDQNQDLTIYSNVLGLSIKNITDLYNNDFFQVIYQKIRNNIKRVKSKTLILSSFVWLFFLSTFFANNMFSKSFWFDESGQFWIAKGLNHYSPQFSPEQGIAQIISNNIQYNLDPGGFSLILRLWTYVSNNPIFLRGLPFIFVVISMLFISKLANKWRPNSKMAPLSGLILLLSPLIKQYSFELRPYSMEMFAGIASLTTLSYHQKILSRKLYSLFFGGILAILITSRYSAIIPILVALSLTFLISFSKNRSRHTFINFSILVIPIILSLISIYFTTYIYQNPNGTPPFYVADLTLKNSSIQKILLNKPAIQTIFPYVILSLLYFLSIIFKRFSPIVKPYRHFLFFTLLLNLIFIFASILGKYPWAINYRWDIDTHSLFFVSWIPLTFITLDVIKKINPRLSKIFTMIILTGFVGLTYTKVLNFRYSQLDTTYINFSENHIKPNAKILINASASPSIRYLFEYGPLKEPKYRQIYSNIAIFNHPDYYSAIAKADLSNIDKYDYIVITHYDYQNSELKKIIDTKPYWVNRTIQGPSQLFENTHSNTSSLQ